jgi:hypothetical protein
MRTWLNLLRLPGPSLRKSSPNPDPSSTVSFLKYSDIK